MTDTPLVCLVTHPVDGAEAFARRLVEARLAACVNRLPVTSTYRWQGAVEADDEVLLLLKTTRARWGELQRFLTDEHPYDVPESIALEPGVVGGEYLQWWLDATSETPSR